MVHTYFLPALLLDIFVKKNKVCTSYYCFECINVQQLGKTSNGILDLSYCNQGVSHSIISQHKSFGVFRLLNCSLLCILKPRVSDSKLDRKPSSMLCRTCAVLVETMREEYSRLDWPIASRWRHNIVESASNEKNSDTLPPSLRWLQSERASVTILG